MILHAENLNVRMGDTPVLRNIGFSLAAGQVLGLVGESGAGKSMIGRAIARMLPAGFAVTGGSLTLDGADLLAMPAARHRALLGRDIAFIPQEPLTALNPVLTIGRQFDEHLRRLGIARRRQASVAALESVHLADAAGLLSRYPHQLSGGMCQRVLIAMAFAGKPKLVVADEPTTALDVTIEARIMALMIELQRAHGTAVLFITHNLRLAARICDDIAVLYSGAVVERGPAREVLARPAHPYTRCLQLADPALTGPRRALYALPDNMPGLREAMRTQGCRFAPRCPVAADECARVDPPLGPRAACLRTELTGSIAAPDTEAVATEAGTSAVLEVSGLRKRFITGGLFRRGATVAVRGADFSVREGEFVAVVGESGSGKSTLGRLLVGLETPSGGRIVLDGCDVTGGSEAARRHRVATVQMVFQDPQSALNPRRRVADIVTQALEARGVGQTARLVRARALLAEIGLPPDAASRVPHQLSGGQKQRVNIARALCSLPRLLVADEIVSGLDVSVQAQLLLLLARLRAEHRFALLFISHDLAVVRHLCDRVLVMRHGEIVEQGDVAEVFASPRHEYTRELLAAAGGVGPM